MEISFYVAFIWAVAAFHTVRYLQYKPLAMRRNADKCILTIVSYILPAECDADWAVGLVLYVVLVIIAVFA